MVLDIKIANNKIMRPEVVQKAARLLQFYGHSGGK